jgi:hypothetical protein
MGTLTNGKFWVGVLAGVALYYLYQNHFRGKTA